MRRDHSFQWLRRARLESFRHSIEQHDKDLKGVVHYFKLSADQGDADGQCHYSNVAKLDNITVRQWSWLHPIIRFLATVAPLMNFVSGNMNWSPPLSQNSTRPPFPLAIRTGFISHCNCLNLIKGEMGSVLSLLEEDYLTRFRRVIWFCHRTGIQRCQKPKIEIQYEDSERFSEP
jgi:hypothetical protein